MTTFKAYACSVLLLAGLLGIALLAAEFPKTFFGIFCIGSSTFFVWFFAQLLKIR